MAQLLLPRLSDECQGSSFIEPAPLVDVLFDQLEYLVSHAAQGCPEGCADCARFREIQRLLLLPFNPPNVTTTLASFGVPA
jgi:hypothetical protein